MFFEYKINLKFFLSWSYKVICKIIINYYYKIYFVIHIFIHLFLLPPNQIHCLLIFVN
jgi:hypothetical protein